MPDLRQNRVMQPMHNVMQLWALAMRSQRPKLAPLSIPEITDGMCGRCDYWHPMADDEGGDCAVLAVSHLRGSRVKHRMPTLHDEWAGPLVTAVHERTMAADDGWYWTETGGGEVVPAEDFSGVPRVFYDERGEKRKVWSPLRSHPWFGCSRYRREKEREAA